MFITRNTLSNDNFHDTDTLDDSEISHDSRNSYSSEQRPYDDTKLQKIQEDYNKALNEYKNYINIYHRNYPTQNALTYFDYPSDHFVMENQKLKLIQHPEIDFSKPAEAFNNLKLPISPGNYLEKELLHQLEHYLNCNISPCCEPPVISNENLFTICGNLFLYQFEDASLCLSSSDIEKFFASIGKMPYPKQTCQTKQLIKNCRNQLSHNYIQIEQKNPAIIFVQAQIEHCCYKYEYSKTDNCIYSPLIPQDENFKYLKACNCIYVRSIANPQITPEISNILYYITNGDFKALCRWSMLFANIASCEYLTKKIFVISCTCDYNDSIRSFLNSIFYNMTHRNSYAIPHHSLKEVISASATPLLCTYQASGGKYFLIDKIEHLDEDEDVKRLKRIVSGKSIDYEDEIFGNITYTNNLPVICIANSDEDLNYLKNNYPCIELCYHGTKTSHDNVTNNMPTADLTYNNTPNVNTLNTEKTLSNTDPYDWLRLKLSLYGLYYINNISDKTIIKQSTPELRCILNAFLDLCCTDGKKETEFTTAADLHNAYLYFYSHLYPGTALSKRKFIKALKLYRTFEYKRPHVSRSGGNPYAFMGIKLKDNYKEIVDAESDNTFPSPDAKLFYEQLNKINQKFKLES